MSLQYFYCFIYNNVTNYNNNKTIYCSSTSTQIKIILTLTYYSIMVNFKILKISFFNIYTIGIYVCIYSFETGW